MGKFVYVRENKTQANQPGWWKESKRIEVVTLYLSTGSPSETSRISGVPLKTVESWMGKDWWKELIAKIRSEEDQALDAKLSKSMDRALTELMDRLENGEYIYDQKTGKVKRMPAKLRDLNIAFNNILDKRQLIRKQPTKIVEQQTTAVALQQLAESFAKFVNKTEKELPTHELIEGETVVQGEDGVYEIKE